MQCQCERVCTSLQAIAPNHALRKGKALWTATGRQALQDLALPTTARKDGMSCLRLYTQLEKRIQQLDKQVEAKPNKDHRHAGC